MRTPALYILAVVGLACGGAKGVHRTQTRIAAVGAEVTLTFSATCGPSDTVCTNLELSSVTRATSSAPGVLSVLEATLDGRRAVVRFKANAVGTSTLTLEFVDTAGKPRQVPVEIQVVMLESVTPWVQCTQEVPLGSRYALGAGATFSVTFASSVSDGDDVLTGNLALAQMPGFEALGPSATGGQSYRAPETPGTYTWTLANGQTMSVRVYAPAEVVPELISEHLKSTSPATVRLRGLVDGVASCVPHGDVLATLEVAGGGCTAVMAGFELEAPVQVDLRDVLRFAVLGDSACTVTASTASGKSASLTFDPPARAVAVPPSGPGQPVTNAPFEVAPPAVSGSGAGGACNSSLSDGQCKSLYDGDCYVDSDWTYRHESIAPGLDGGRELDSKALVGVGLTTSLQLRIEIPLLLGLPSIIVGPPQALTYEAKSSYLFAGNIDVSVGGCTDTGSRKVLTIKPNGIGTHQLYFRASNVDDVGKFEVMANKVETATFKTLVQGKGPAVTAPMAEVFNGTHLVTEAHYRNATGQELRGVTALRLEDDVADGGTLVTSGLNGGQFAFYTGGPGHAVTVSSSLGTGTQRFFVRGTEGITAIGGFESATFAVGAVQAIKPPVALGQKSVPILGKAPGRPVLKLTGAAAAIRYSMTEDNLWLVGLRPGDMTLQMTWGPVVAEKTWTVTPPP